MSPRPVQAALAGAAAGFAGGLFGVGGGIILVPVLTGSFHLTQNRAHGTSLAIVGATALVSIVVYALHGNVDWLTALIVGMASIVTARWGARLAARTPPDRLRSAFAALLVVVAIRMLWGTPHGGGHALAPGVLGLAADVVIGAAAGLLAGYMGVGGGVVAVPAFAILLGMPQQLAQGTSLAVILVTAPFGAFEHHRHGNVAVALVPLIALGTVLGGPLGSIVAQKLPQVVLARAFSVFLIVNAVGIWVRAARTRRAVPGRPRREGAD